MEPNTSPTPSDPEPPHAVPDPPHAVAEPPDVVPEPPHAVPEPPHTVPEPPHAVTDPSDPLHPTEKGAKDSGSPDEVHLTSVPPTERADGRRGRDRLRVSRAVAALAGRQHGAVTTAQLLELGFTHHDLVDSVAGGRLHRVHQGVYLVGHTAMAPLTRDHAALLACGGAAILSHRSAAALWNLTAPTRVPDVTVVGRHVRKRKGIRLHLVDAIDMADVQIRHGLKVTGAVRTLVDLAAVADADTLEAALSEAYALRRITEPQLHQALEHNQGRPGAAGLRALVDTQDGPEITKSWGERKLRALLRKAGLPQPVSNRQLLGYAPDLLWPEQRLIVEFDGFQWHGHRARFESDRARDAALTAAGYRVIRITKRQLVNEPFKVLANLARALGPDNRFHH